jgi:GcrA cell cycle regulator
MSAWNDTRVETLTRLWREGLSASQIARSLAGGVTRNAVIGKIHRLGLAGRAKASRPGVRARRAERPARQPRHVARLSPRPPPAPMRTVAEEVLGPPPEGGLASILTIGRRQCRWPIGEPGTEGFALCGRPVVRGAYCGCHANLGYQPPKPRNHLLKLAGL